MRYVDEAGTFTGAYRRAGVPLRINQSRIVNGHTRLTEYDVLPDGSWRPALKEEDSGYDVGLGPWRHDRSADRSLHLGGETSDTKAG